MRPGSEGVRRLSAAMVVVALGAGLVAAAADPRVEPVRAPAPEARERALAPAPPVRAPAGMRRARARLADALGPAGRLEIDEATGGVRFLGRLDGYLTRPASGDPRDIVLAHLRRHRSVFGLGDRELRGLRLVARHRAAGLWHLRWQQRHRGVPLHGAGLRAAVDRRGRILAIAGSARPDVGAPRTSPAVPRRRAHRIAAGAAAAGARSELVLLARGERPRLAWRVSHRDGPHAWLTTLDAASGAVLERRDEVRAAQGRAWDLHPGAAGAAGQAQLRDLTPWLEASTGPLRGPRAHAFTDLDDDWTVDAGEDVEPGAGGDFDFPRIALSVDGGNCPAAGCSWNPGQVPASILANREQSATQLFYFVNRFSEHLEAEPIGFTEARGGFAGADAVRARALVGATTAPMLNNASMYTPPDGEAPVLSTGLYRPDYVESPASSRPLALVSGADDGTVVYHELAHGFLARTVVDDQGRGALSALQSGALDEGLADFLAMDYVVANGWITDTAAPGEVRVGQLLDGGRDVVRHQPLDCPVAPSAACGGSDGAGPGGFTLADYGRILDLGPEAHADGELVAETLWDLRTRMIAGHGEAAGTVRTRELVASALRLSPPEPSLLDFRNALLQADVATGGGDRDAIWEVFAERGMGWYAATVDAGDRRPVADDTLPPVPGQDGTIAGTLATRDGGAISGATVRVAAHATELRTVTIPGLRAQTGAGGAFSITGVPAGTYPALVFEAPGHRRVVRRDVSVAAGATTTVNGSALRNLADAHWGATAQAPTPDPECRPGLVNDGRPLTGWAGAPGDAVTVTLPEDVTVTSFGIDPTARCRYPFRASLGDYEIQVSRNGSRWSTVAGGEFGPGDRHVMQDVRPAAPLDDVRHVRLVARSPQNGGDVVSLGELQVYAVPARPPRASFGVQPAAPRVDEPATFDASSSVPGDAEITTYAWDLDGDRDFEVEGAEPRAEHTFTQRGRVRVTLRVTAADGETDEFSRLLYVDSDAIVFAIDEAGDAPGAAQQVAPGGNAVGVAPYREAPGDSGFSLVDGDYAPLPPLPGDAISIAEGINDAGVAVGHSSASDYDSWRAVRWVGGVPQDLGLGPRSTAIGINAAGSIVGAADFPEGPRRPFVLHGGAPVEVQAAAGVPEEERERGRAIEINDAGDVVGCLEDESDYLDNDCRDGFRVRGGTFEKLLKLGDRAGATGLNGVGDAVGLADDPLTGERHAVVWSALGGYRDLGTLGGDYAQARAINDAGDVVGESRHLSGQLRAFLHRKGEDGMRDLNDLVADGDWILRSATGITDRDEIVGWGIHDGVQRAYQLNLGPCRVCVTDVRFEHRVRPGGPWLPVGDAGTVDGNAVRVIATVRNEDDRPRSDLLVRAGERRAGAIGEAAAVAGPLAPGEEAEVSWEWDTDGLSWEDEVPASDRLLRVAVTRGKVHLGARTVPVKVRPRPVVLVHGMASSAATWSEYPRMLRRLHPDLEGFAVDTMDTGSFAAPLHEPNTIDENAELLRTFVEGVRDGEQAAHVDLVGHSMGGLISRQYIATYMPEDPAAGRPVARHLIQLGTPNRGSPCAELLDLPLFYQLRRDNMAEFNGYVRDRRGVEFSVLAGTDIPIPCDPGTTGDLVVPEDSAVWEIEDVGRQTIEHTQMTRDAAAFSGFVAPRLAGAAAGAAAGRRSAVAAEPADAGRRALLLADGAGSADGATLASFTVPAGRDLQVNVVAAPETTTILRGPGGTPEVTIAGGSREAAQPVRTLAVEEPAPGTWTLHAAAPAHAAAGVAWSARLVQDPLRLVLGAGSPGADGRVHLAARFAAANANLASGSMVARIRSGEGDPEATVTLFDDGAHGDGGAADGCYAAHTPALAPGAHLVRLEAAVGGRERVLLQGIATGAGEGEPGAAQCPSVTGNGSLYAGVKGEGYNVREIDPDTGEVDFWRDAWVPTQEPERGAVFGPDGRLAVIARLFSDPPPYPSGWSAGRGIVIPGPDGSEGPRITPNQHVVTAAAWSPDGSRLAYTAQTYPQGCTFESCPETTGLYVVDDDGANVVGPIATGGHQWVVDPAWSADGRILFSQRVPGEGYGTWRDYHLFSIEPDGTGLQRLTHTPQSVRAAAVSPDGTRWLVSREQPAGVTRIWSMAPGGSDQVMLSGGAVAGPDEKPTWSPDGRLIGFVRGGFGSGKVWTMAADGTGQVLTYDFNQESWETSGGVTWLTWGPAPLLGTQSAPECRAAPLTAVTGAPERITLFCSDPNGDPLTVSIAEAPAHGTLSEVGDDGAVTYTSHAGYTGPDRFTFRATDGLLESSLAEITVDVRETPPPPVHDDGYTPPAGGGATGPLPGGTGAGNGGGGGDEDGADPGARPAARCFVDSTGKCKIFASCPEGAQCQYTAKGVIVLISRATVAGAAKRPKARSLVKTTRRRIAGGTTRPLALRLTRKGRRLVVKRRRRLVVDVRVVGRRSGRVISDQVLRVTFKPRRKGKRAKPIRLPAPGGP